MGKKDADGNKKLVAALASAAAVFAVRKLLTVGWRRATGKTPPNPADPQVRLLEVVGWAIVAGVSVEATKFLTARLTGRRELAAADAADVAGS
ncbi:MAG TPA: DUF4235 domain-containing protein [Trebonia sp.]|jgi:hypothetical protein|nr:DUF4235 domain-containing protein [Trebonia sp.]